MDKIFEVINNNSDSPYILTCEHASAKIPESYHNLGLPDEELERHIARDKGAKEVTELLAQRIGCFAVMGGYSRLLIDLNRRTGDEELIVEESDKTVVPDNIGLSKIERQLRIDTYYRPYYAAIEKQIAYLKNKGIKPIVFSIHSYTPQLKEGNYRPWQAGILSHKPAKLADYLYKKLSENINKNIGQNVPYDLRKYNTGAAVICGEEKGLDYALIEIRDDEFSSLERGALIWADMLAKLLNDYISVSNQ